MQNKRLIIISSNNKPKSPGGLAVAINALKSFMPDTLIEWHGVTKRPSSDPLIVQEEHDAQLKTFDHHFSVDTYDGFYEGHANGFLWSLFHNETEGAEFDDDAYQKYFQLNQQLADEIVAEYGGTEEAVDIWIHDYQLMPLVKMLKDDTRINCTIRYTHHIPFPALETIKSLSAEAQTNFMGLIESILRADNITVQVHRHFKRFRDIAKDVGFDAGNEQTPEYYDTANWRSDGHCVSVMPCPIGPEPEGIDLLAIEAQQSDEFKKILSNIAPDIPYIYQVGRLDPTKGWGKLLSTYKRMVSSYLKHSFNDAAADTGQSNKLYGLIAVAPKSRENVPVYKKLIERFNGIRNDIKDTIDANKLGRIFYVHDSKVNRNTGFALARNADIITMMSDEEGMGLVALEGYMAQDPNRKNGPAAVIVGKNTGAAEILGNTVITVDTTDPDDMDRALKEAQNMSIEERQFRHAEAKDKIENQYNIKIWGINALGVNNSNPPEPVTA